MEYIAMLENKKYNIKLSNNEQLARDELAQVLDNAINLILAYTYNSYETNESILEALLEDTMLEYEELDESEEE